MESVTWFFVVLILVSAAVVSVKLLSLLNDQFRTKPVLSAFENQNGHWLSVSEISVKANLPNDVVISVVKSMLENGILDYKVRPELVEKRAQEICYQYPQASKLELEKIATNEVEIEIEESCIHDEQLLYHLVYTPNYNTNL